MHVCDGRVAPAADDNKICPELVATGELAGWFLGTRCYRTFESLARELDGK